MPVAHETLPDLVRRRLIDLGERGKPLSMRAAARRSGNDGLYETIRKIVEGRHQGKLTPDTAQYLATGLELPVARILRAAGMAQTRMEPFDLPARFARLTATQRQVVIAVGDAILKAADDAAEEVRARYHQTRPQPNQAKAAGEIIEQARKKAGYSVRIAAMDAHIEPNEWTAIVAGDRPVDADIWFDMAIAATADPATVFTALGIPTPGRDTAQT